MLVGGSLSRCVSENPCLWSQPVASSAASTAHFRDEPVRARVNPSSHTQFRPQTVSSTNSQLLHIVVDFKSHILLSILLFQEQNSIRRFSQRENDPKTLQIVEITSHEDCKKHSYTEILCRQKKTIQMKNQHHSEYKRPIQSTELMICWRHGP